VQGGEGILSKLEKPPELALMRGGRDSFLGGPAFLVLGIKGIKKGIEELPMFVSP
jgi:hypothetical protein